MKKLWVLVLALSLLFVSAQPAAALIKWVDFNVPYAALQKTMKLDIDSHEKATKLHWIELLSVLACQYGGSFKKYRETDVAQLEKRLQSGETIGQITEKYKHYDYYYEAYTAVLGGLLGEYRQTDESGIEQTKYGLRAYNPIAKGFGYSHCDDFGTGRSYGFTRKHLGHDMMCATGTPVIAVETGRVEVMGWNQYGGWRIGIRSLDSKRYYYYAHLRKDRPFHADLSEGKTVHAGTVIGYVGRTGYSRNENVNNIKTSHLHFGLQLVFDESQKECNNEIWIDVYPLVKLLERHRSAVRREPESKEYYPVTPLVPVMPLPAV